MHADVQRFLTDRDHLDVACRVVHRVAIQPRGVAGLSGMFGARSKGGHGLLRRLAE